MRKTERGGVSLRFRFMAVVAVLAVAPLVWLGISLDQRIARRLDLEAEARHQAWLEWLAADLTASVESLRHEVLQARRFPPVDGLFRARDNGGIDPLDGRTEAQWEARLQQLFAPHLASHLSLRQMRLLDSSGRELVRVNIVDGNPIAVAKDQLQDKSSRHYFVETAALKSGETYVSPLDLNVEHGKVEQPHSPVLRVATPVWLDGRLRGVLVINQSAHTILSRLRSAAQGTIILASAVGTYLYHPDPAKLWGPQLPTDANLYRDWPQLRATEADGRHLIERDDQVFAWTRVPIISGGPRRHWILGAIHRRSAFYATRTEVREMITRTALVTAILTLLLGLILATVWFRPLKVLAQAARRLTAGDFTVRVADEKQHELGEVGRAFNQMAEALGRQTESLELEVAERTAEVKKSEARFRGIMEASSDGIVLVDDNARIIIVNGALERMCGYAQSELLGQPIEILVPSRFSAHEQHRNEYLEHPTSRGMQEHSDRYVLRKDGTEFPAGISLNPLRTDEGFFVSAIVRDITTRGKAEQELEKHRDNLEELVAERSVELRKLSQAVEQSPVSVHITDKDGTIQYVNPVFTQTTGYSAEEAVGRNPRFLKSGSLSRAFYADLWETILSGRTWKGEFINRRKNGEEFWERASISPIRDPDGEITHFVAIKEDITEQKQAGQELALAKDAADAASRAKGEFLANMSHEIRTPLNAIIGLTYLLANTALDHRQKDYVVKVGSASQALLAIINDILDLSKIEAGKLDLESVEFQLNDVLRNMLDMVSMKADEKGLELLFHTDSNVPLYMTGDPLRLGQILLNLVGNAIKFTASGEIVVSSRLLQRDDDRATLELSVRDTGIGMTRAKMSGLFQPFSQADTSTTREFGGTGLGLSISRQLVEMMGGKIRVDSRPGEGSVFTFSAVFARPQDSRWERLKPLPSWQGLRVLVVDDNATSREILGEVLESLTFDVSLAASGQEAVAMVDAAADDESPQLVIMDYKMPDMNGIETSEKLAGGGRAGADTPMVIMVTAHGSEEVQQKATQVGIRSLLLKPVTPSTLFDAVVEAFGGESQRPRSLSLRRRPDTGALQMIRGARVLLVEDNEINRQVARELLEVEGVVVSLARTGAEAVRMVGERQLDAVLMDIQMPEMDGYAATRKIRSDARFAGLPIIAMTANAMAGDRTKALDAGMNDHVAKPIDPAQMFHTLARWIGGGGEAATEEGKRSHRQTSRSIATVPDEWPELSGIDVEAGLNVTAGNVELYGRLLVRFRAENADLVDRIKAALNRGNVEGAERLAHTAKGVAGNLGAGDVCAAAGSLEATIRFRRAHALVAGLKELRESLDVVLSSLADLDVGAQDESTGAELDPEALRGLSGDQVAALREATELGDLDALLVHIDDLEGSDHKAAAGLRRLASNFEYERILQLLSTKADRS